MAATRLSDGQKGEIVARFGNGESSQELANAFGCSTATITRVVKAALSPDDYERLKAQRGRRGRSNVEPELMAHAADQPAAVATAATDSPVAAADEQPVAQEALPPPASAGPIGAAGGELLERTDANRAESAAETETEAEATETEAEESASVLAIDDADDFGGNDDDISDEDPGDGDVDDFTPIPLVLNLDSDSLLEPRPLQGADLPGSAYMLVDKTVELQARPLSDLPELGRLSPGEEERQALVMFINPRQAKRQCGRTQRVIKMPDLGLLERTAPYLLAQGISRVVIEGALYALPGS